MMKNLAAKLKGMDYKQIGIEHGEKIGMVIVGLFALFALLGTRWAPYAKTPHELTTKVAQSEATISVSTWPDEEKQKFISKVNIRDEAKQLLTKTDFVGKFHYTQDVIWPLYKPIQPIKEPGWLPVQGLLAMSGSALITVFPELEEGKFDPDSLPEGAGGPGEDIDLDDFRPRTGTGVGGLDSEDSEFGSGSSGLGSSGLGRPGASPGNRGSRIGSRGRGSRGGSGLDGAYPYPDYDEDGEGGYGEGGYGMAAAQQGLGVRFASVVGVYPLRDQLDKIRKAMGESAFFTGNIAEFVDLIDFQIERQTMVPGPNPWSGPFEKVDIKPTMDVMRQATNFETDVVATTITDPVITSPLPQRINGYWDKYASHPKLKNFVLSKEKRALEEELNKRVLDEFEKRKAMLPQRIEKKGFYEHLVDINQARQMVLGGSSSSEQFVDNLKNDDEYDQDNDYGMMRQFVRDSKAAGQLLLFRYLDFSVEPGDTYRYRVRLQLRNPNHNRPLDELEDPAIAKDPTRWTEWSDPTPPVAIRRDVDFFLTKVSPARGTSEPSAMLNVFQWYTKTGTTINSNLRTIYGQFVGGEKKTELLDPAAGTFEEEKVEFTSNDALVDVHAAPTFGKNDHPDLNLDALARQSLGLSRVLVVNKFGELVLVDPISQYGALQKKTARLEAERTAFEFLKQQSGIGEEGLEGYDSEDYEGGYPPGYGSSSMRPGMGNPLRKSGGNLSPRARSRQRRNMRQGGSDGEGYPTDC